MKWLEENRERRAQSKLMALAFSGWRLALPGQQQEPSDSAKARSLEAAHHGVLRSKEHWDLVRDLWSLDLGGTRGTRLDFRVRKREVVVGLVARAASSSDARVVRATEEQELLGFVATAAARRARQCRRLAHFRHREQNVLNRHECGHSRTTGAVGARERLVRRWLEEASKADGTHEASHG